MSRETGEALHNPPAFAARTPDFYEQHVWLWESNPAGLLQDWNPEVSC